MIAACSSAPDKRTLPPDDPYCKEDSLHDFAILLGAGDGITYDIETVDPKTGKRYAEIQIRDRTRLDAPEVKASAFIVVDVTPLATGFLVRATCR